MVVISLKNIFILFQNFKGLSLLYFNFFFIRKNSLSWMDNNMSMDKAKEMLFDFIKSILSYLEIVWPYD